MQNAGRARSRSSGGILRYRRVRKKDRTRVHTYWSNHPRSIDFRARPSAAVFARSLFSISPLPPCPTPLVAQRGWNQYEYAREAPQLSTSMRNFKPRKVRERTAVRVRVKNRVRSFRLQPCRSCESHLARAFRPISIFNLCGVATPLTREACATL